MYDNDIILTKKDNGDVIESSKALSIFNAKIATIDYENEQFSGKSVWMKGRLTNITNVDSKDQRFLDKLNKVNFYNHKLFFTTVTNLPLKEEHDYQILGRFEKSYTYKGVYDSFKIEAILNEDFSFKTIRNLLTMGAVNKKLAEKIVSIYEENNVTPIKALLDIKNAENSTILSDFTEKEIRFIQKALDTTDNSISETIIKAELTPLFGDNNKFPNRVYERYGFNSLATIREDPWETIEAKYPIGSKHTAKVRNFTNFGIFVELEEGVDGLIHISDLSWTKKVKHPSEFTQVGADMDVIVLEIDKENRRLSLGHKQLETNPWDTYESIYTPGSTHVGKITESMDKGAVITLNEGGEGFATPKHLVKEDGSQAQLGEELPFVVIEFVKDTKRIILSHSRTFEEVKEEQARRQRTASKKHSEPASQINNVAAGTSLGDLDVLADLKKKMEEGK